MHTKKEKKGIMNNFLELEPGTIQPLAEDSERMILIPLKDYNRYIENEQTLEIMRKILQESDRIGHKERR